MQDVIAAIIALIATLFGVIAGSEIVAKRMAPPEPVRAEILFGGDMMFDRSIRIASDREGQDFILSCLKSTLEEADLVVANLEGPITAEPSVSVNSNVGDSNNFTFTFPLSTAETLARHNIRVVNLGNNHILNFGRGGLAETTHVLDEAGVSYFGDIQDDTMIYHSVINGVALAFVGYSAFDGSGAEAAITHITAESEKGNIVIVYTHWGDEYVVANDMQKRLARLFIDAGAEIVIGSHPHVIQEHEVYQGKHIYYSLGNLIFDQYWNDEVRRGLLVFVTISPSGVEAVRESHTMLKRDRRTCLIAE